MPGLFLCVFYQALILVPTRELARQVQSVARELGKPVNILDVCVYGGANRHPQITELRKGRLFVWNLFPYGFCLWLCSFFICSFFTHSQCGTEGCSH